MIPFFLKLAGAGKSILKAIGWRGIVIVLIIAAIYGLYLRGNIAIKKVQDRDNVIGQLEQEIAISQAEPESLTGIGEYTQVDTVPYRREINRLKAEIRAANELLHMAYGDSVKLIEPSDLDSLPPIKTKVDIDSTAELAFGDNAVKIGLIGQIFCPEEFSGENWLKVKLLGFKKPLYSPVAPRSPINSKAYAIGLGLQVALTSDKASPIAIGYMRASRMTALGGYDLDRKGWVFGLGYDLIRF